MSWVSCSLWTSGFSVDLASFEVSFFGMTSASRYLVVFVDVFPRLSRGLVVTVPS